MRSSRAFYLAILLTLTASAASAATYYVDDAGSDSNPGTLASPFRTITHGLSLLSNPADTLWVRGGTYNERAVIWNKHGNSTSPIYVGFPAQNRRHDERGDDGSLGHRAYGVVLDRSPRVLRDPVERRGFSPPTLSREGPAG